MIRKNKTIRLPYLLPAFYFGLVFYFLPVLKLEYLQLMPGDIGDSRLNNLFLENIYLFFTGKSSSLWHLNYFHPFPYVLGFSDNLFGTSPIYLFSRVSGFDSETAFQIWFLFGYIANFMSAYFVLRKLGGSQTASSIGALIFAFALPTSAHVSHVQLHYRFGVPLTIYYFSSFLFTQRHNYLAISCVWLVWQFYAGIYTGFFLLLGMSFVTASFFLYQRFTQDKTLCGWLILCWSNFKLETLVTKARAGVIVSLCLIAMLFLFYPYIKVSLMYDASRSWGEISSMLPRVQSYFLSDNSHIWGKLSSALGTDINMRHEHQMFIGALPFFMAICGLTVGLKSDSKLMTVVLIGMFSGFVFCTLYVAGASLWLLFYKLPLASAIRAMTRFDQVLLFPVAYFAMLIVDFLFLKFKNRGSLIIVLVVLPIFILETSAINFHTSNKHEWQDRLRVKEDLFGEEMRDDKVMFFSQRPNQPYYAEEIDAMWITLRKNLKTLNGYSGSWPPGFNAEFGANCYEFPIRLVSYLNFLGSSDIKRDFYKLAKKFKLVGFANCEKRLDSILNELLEAEEIYNASDFSKISYEFDGLAIVDGKYNFVFTIRNGGPTTISASRYRIAPINISWISAPSNNKSQVSWDNRIPLPTDLATNSEISVSIPISDVNQPLVLQVSLVQEGVFWLHDIGIEPLKITIKNDD